MENLLLQNIVNIVHESAKFMDTRSFDVEQKNGYSNIVTSSDIAVQNFLCEKLSSLLPGSGFMCEEKDLWDSTKEFSWIIDPIDGTTNYSRGLDQCAICVGLKHFNDITHGVVYLPATVEMYTAEKGKGAYCNGKRIHVSGRDFQDSIMCTALSNYHKEYAEICKAARRYALAQLTAKERKKAQEEDFDPVEFVETMVLKRYDPVTEYLYYPEADRKRLRLAEGINATRESQNRPGYNALLKRNAKLLKDQFGQYAIETEDQTVIETWKAAGIEKVQWITQDDEKVCAECRPRHLQIYDINRIPGKHYNCRCYWRPVR